MAQTSGLKQRLLVAGLMAAVAGFSSMAGVLAEQTLTGADQPLQVKLTTTLNAETAHYGDHFEGILTESYQMSGKALPEGTVFKGRVQRAHKSMPFGMPGYVVLEIDEAQLPSGAVHHFDQGGVAPKSSRVINPSARNGKKLFKDNLPYTIVSTATSIPLTYATGLSSGVILPITLGSRVLFGVANQLAHKMHPSSPAQQAQQAAAPSVGTAVKQGIMQGSGLNSAYYFLTPAPEPELTAGSVIPLHFKAHDLADLFSAAESSTAKTESHLQQTGQALPASENTALMAQPGK